VENHFKDYINGDSSIQFYHSSEFPKLVLKYGLDHDLCVVSYSSFGQSSFKPGEIEKRLQELGGIKSVTYKYSNCYCEWWMWPDTCVKIIFDGKPGARITGIEIAGCNDCLTQELIKIGETFSNETPNGSVYALIPSSHGLVNKNLGLGAIPINKDNYRPEVITGYDTIIKDLKSASPLGRLAILDGCPGTGKTYLIRALLGDLPEVKFLILPSNMTANLGGPEILSALIDASDNTPDNQPRDPDSKLTKAKTPLVLIIEDADSCLTTRGSDNISAISTILNLSDGIIGNLLDLRIICTTNVDSKDIDKALLRNGRLSARVEVGLLDREQAYRIYLREGGNPEVVFDKKFYSLADVYTMARGGVGSLNEKQTKTVGFKK
jgi:ATPase family associated with various cellular activities (AAA)